MSKAVLLDRVLCLPSVDVVALALGKQVVAFPRVPIQLGWDFVLCPCMSSDDDCSSIQQYRLPFQTWATEVLKQDQVAPFKIQVWARCEYSEMLHDAEKIAALSNKTIWTQEALKEKLKQRQHLFLSVLRVYHLPQPIHTSCASIPSQKSGRFLGLQNLGGQFANPLKLEEFLPVINEARFEKQKQSVIHLKAPLYSDLDILESLFTPLFGTSNAVSEIYQNINVLKTLEDSPFSQALDPDLEWIETITNIGNSSDGHSFEKLVRRALLKLGFTGSSLSPDSTGGAGGMDFHCEYPYSVVGECKATKTETVSDGTPAQLLKIGINHLGKELYNNSIKIIVAAGNLNFYALRTATENEMNVIRPETLQSLVQLQAKYPGSINLINLKDCLQLPPFGMADEKVINYIEEIQKGLKVRAELIQAIKQLTEPNRTKLEITEIRTHYNAVFGQKSDQKLDNKQTREILIELSSPLTGYLGRCPDKENKDNDRFYFLRDLIVD